MKIIDNRTNISSHDCDVIFENKEIDFYSWERNTTITDAVAFAERLGFEVEITLMDTETLLNYPSGV